MLEAPDHRVPQRRLGGVAQLHDRPVFDEETGERGRLGKVAAAIGAQIQHQPADRARLEVP